eukprot:TRINITY_DN599_c0_g1_i14.p1 TRINITY_DN599_c0_g1~~TRINITY_DN599_c0_g1_i14.p1  ORF type:complete len:342 (+),score=43.78 TRINITY_DN599_c0_g1_i14:71-1096(+)
MNRLPNSVNSGWKRPLGNSTQQLVLNSDETKGITGGTSNPFSRKRGPTSEPPDQPPPKRVLLTDSPLFPPIHPTPSQDFSGSNPIAVQTDPRHLWANTASTNSVKSVTSEPVRTTTVPSTLPLSSGTGPQNRFLGSPYKPATLSLPLRNNGLSNPRQNQASSSQLVQTQLQFSQPSLTKQGLNNLHLDQSLSVNQPRLASSEKSANTNVWSRPNGLEDKLIQDPRSQQNQNQLEQSRQPEQHPSSQPSVCQSPPKLLVQVVNQMVSGQSSHVQSQSYHEKILQSQRSQPQHQSQTQHIQNKFTPQPSVQLSPYFKSPFQKNAFIKKEFGQSPYSALIPLLP